MTTDAASRTPRADEPIIFAEVYICRKQNDTVSGLSEYSQEEIGKSMIALYGKDIQVVIQAELEKNVKVRTLVCAYEELTETDKALFRLASGISQEVASSRRGSRPKPNVTPDSGDEPGELQPLVRNLMKTILEDYPTLLTDADIRNLMSREYCKSTLGIRIANHPLLRRMEQGSKDHNGRGRYYVDPYAGKFYLCSQWWKDYHLTNAKNLLWFVTELTRRNPGHLGVPALERHRQALYDYIGQPNPDGNSLE